jgi:hypothetical protein
LSDFARFSTPIYDEPKIDLYHLICVLYLVREDTEAKEERLTIKSPMLVRIQKKSSRSPN